MSAIVSSLAVAAVPPRPLLAQELPGTEASGAPDASGFRHALDAGWWLGAGYNRHIVHVPAASAASDQSLTADHARQQLGLTLSYAQRRRRLSLGADVESAFRVDSTTRRFVTLDHRAGLEAALSLSPRMQVEVRQQARYAAISPLLAGPAGDTDDPAASVALPGIDYVYPIRRAMTSTTETALTHAVTRRSSVVVSHRFTHSEDDYRGSLQAHQVGGRLDRRIGPYRTLRLGYRLTRAMFDPESRRYLEAHDIDAGLDYQRQLPFSRRTTLTAATGSSIISDRSRRTFRLLADATVAHAVNRSWLARVSFSRPVQMVEGMATPLILTSIAADVAGEFGRRHRLLATVGYTRGRVSVEYTRNTAVEAYSAAVLWRTALTRRLALNAEAFNGRSRFGPQVAAASGVSPDSQTLGARVFLSYRRPLLRQ